MRLAEPPALLPPPAAFCLCESTRGSLDPAPCACETSSISFSPDRSLPPAHSGRAVGLPAASLAGAVLHPPRPGVTLPHLLGRRRTLQTFIRVFLRVLGFVRFPSLVPLPPSLWRADCAHRLGEEHLPVFRLPFPKPKSNTEPVLASSKRNTEKREEDLERKTRRKGRRRWVCRLPQQRSQGCDRDFP